MPDMAGSRTGLAETEHRVQSDTGAFVRIFAISMAALYFEILVIRYIGTEVRIFAYLKNVTLLAGFCGMGVGLVLPEIPRWIRISIPWLFASLFLATRYSQFLRLTYVGFSPSDNPVWGNLQPHWPELAVKVAFVIVLATFFTILMGFFIFVGGLVGRELKQCQQLTGYSANLAGSLAGMLLFSAISFYNAPPAIWILAGCLLLSPFVHGQRFFIVVMLCVTILVAVPEPGTFWSPYYRIDFRAFPAPLGLQTPVAYELDVNHDYHQKTIDLSSGFVHKFPNYYPNNEALSFYELPYKMLGLPGDVLVVGAGTGNDVAAALRHGADHVDAVEIDPTIAALGKRYHPERPYDSPKVRVIVDDARAFFNRAQRKYDVIIFGHLDSHTLLSSFSSLRLDNFVYTLESFRRAKDLLKENGSMFVAFGSGRTFVTTRQFATLKAALGSPPKALFTGYDIAGVLFVYGKAQGVGVANMEDMTSALTKDATDLPVTTDTWPFVYLPKRTIPTTTLLSLLVVWICIKNAIRNTIGFATFRDWKNIHFFLLGCGFLLLEANAIAKLSLLFGSTWIVNAVVISAFLGMALAANMVVARVKISNKLNYGGLALALLVSSSIPYYRFTSSLLPALVAGLLIALPVFFSGLIFSSSFGSVPSPTNILGVNMLGSALGGILENLTMIGGTTAISILAFLVYFFSALALSKAERTGPDAAVTYASNLAQQ